MPYDGARSSLKHLRAASFAYDHDSASTAATEDNVARWLEVAKRTTVAELERAVAWSHETVHDFALESYESAMSKTNPDIALRARPVGRSGNAV